LFSPAGACTLLTVTAVAEALLVGGVRVVDLDILSPYYDQALNHAHLAWLQAMSGTQSGGCPLHPLDLENSEAYLRINRVPCWLIMQGCCLHWSLRFSQWFQLVARW